MNSCLRGPEGEHVHSLSVEQNDKHINVKNIYILMFFITGKNLSSKWIKEKEFNKEFNKDFKKNLKEL